ncbi:hypothetical protein [Spirochaeta dissipatitropha]
MKKTLRVVIIALVFLGLSSTVYSIGIGASFGGIGRVGGNPGTSTMLSLKFDQAPFLLGVGAHNGVLALTADWWLANNRLINFINYYAGLGVYTVVGSNNFDVGGRMPLGLNVFPIDILELFIEIAPTLGVDVSPVNLKFGLHSAIGFRFWF